jgi:hypothetical protein
MRLSEAAVRAFAELLVKFEESQEGSADDRTPRIRRAKSAQRSRIGRIKTDRRGRKAA